MLPVILARPAEGSALRLAPWRELSICALLLMDLSWAVPWIIALSASLQASDVWNVFLVFGAVFVLAHWLIRLLEHWQFSTLARQGVILVYLVGMAVISSALLLPELHQSSLSRIIEIWQLGQAEQFFSDEIIIILGVFLAAGRGIGLAQDYLGTNVVVGRFRFGLVMLLSFFILNSLVTGASPGVLMYIFLVSGLLAMSAARFAALNKLTSSPEQPFHIKWAIVLLLSSVGLVMFSALATAATYCTIEWVADVFALLLVAILLILGILLSPLMVLLIEFLERFPGFEFTINLLVEKLKHLLLVVQTVGGEMLKHLSEMWVWKVVSTLGPGMRWLLIVGSIFVILAAIILLAGMQLWMERLRTAANDEREMIAADKNALQYYRRELARRLGQLRKNWPGGRMLKRGERVWKERRIRWIYAQLIEASTKLGSPRRPAWTPLEFLPVLQAQFPELASEVNTITRAYLDVRYGELPENPVEVAKIEQAWERLRAAGKEQRKAAR